MEFSHVDQNGRAKMVDVSSKKAARRIARAYGYIKMSTNTIALIRENMILKGDVLTVAKIAGINATKQTSTLIPLCHNIEIDFVDVDFVIKDDRILIRSIAVCVDRTGIEMEALTAVSVAALTVYDMCKAVDKNMVISDIRLVDKVKKHYEPI